MSLRTARSLTIVIKLGTSSICDETTHLPLLSNLSLVVETIVKLRSLGHKVVLVSSGAIGVGLRRLEMDKKPKKLSAVQTDWTGGFILILIY
ncbi:16959_t:CDS:2 [Entrophospora sp. SA101]|nr:16959_t:CDS:2 [Entrophospora sp. SA101]